MVHVDFETDGLYGPFMDGFAITDDGDESTFTDSLSLMLYLKLMTGRGEFVTFWNHWHVRYLQMMHFGLMEELHGHYMVFSDIHSFIFGTWKSGHNCKIDDMTKKLCNRDHVGNARQDAIDLRECFHTLNREVITWQTESWSREFSS